jgi:hypothetical protein
MKGLEEAQSRNAPRQTRASAEKKKALAGRSRRGPCGRAARLRGYFELCGRNRKPPQNW